MQILLVPAKRITVEMNGRTREPLVALVAPLEAGQVAAGLLYSACLALWLYAVYLDRFKRTLTAHRHSDRDEDVEQQRLATSPSRTLGEGVPLEPSISRSLSGSVSPRHKEGYCAPHLTALRLLRLEHDALAASQPALRAGVEFGTIMLWFYVADRTTVIPTALKAYSRDLLAFLFLCLTVVFAATSAQVARAPVLLNRNQTEEWKGWMQVLFLLYHYFEAREIYNAIRIFIAAYVWMTGYNNFSYYYKYKDFNVTRFLSMMWRLNFLVAAVCVVMHNSYMLYYICPMHTLFTIMVYAVLGIASQYNEHHWGIVAKLAASVVAVFVIWDIKPIFHVLFGIPGVRWLVEYTDPRHPTTDTLHEWYFRSSLDRYVWIHGMACAYAHSWAEPHLQRIDGLPRMKRWLVRGTIGAGALAILALWGTHVYSLPKIQYNSVHPYTSWIPITAYIVLRNLTPQLRMYSLAMYGWLGKITLETYIGQFHTWLATGVPNGQPKLLLAFFPKDYPLLNFAATTAVYIWLSHRLFCLTDALRKVIIPDKAPGQVLLRNGLSAAAVGVVLWLLGLAIVQLAPAMHFDPGSVLARDVGIHFHP